MALTDAQIVDVRRFMGYPITGDNSYGSPMVPAYSNSAPWISVELDKMLSVLTPSREAVVVMKLEQLTQLELDLYGASGVRDNIDTAKAAV